MIVADGREFQDTVAAFYAHMLRHTGTVEGAVDPGALGDDAAKLLDRTFGGKAGVEAAKVEASNAPHGGMRYVLDAMTEQLKREKQEDYVRYVLGQALDSENWESKVEFMSVLLKRLARELPPDIHPETPARYAKNWDVIARAYVSSQEKVTTLLRSM